MDATTNSINCCEIPAKVLARAKKFSDTVLGIKLTPMGMPGMTSEMFPMSPASGKVNGCLAKSSMHKPATNRVGLHSMA